MESGLKLRSRVAEFGPKSNVYQAFELVFPESDSKH